MVNCLLSSTTQSLSYSRFHNFLFPFGNLALNSLPLFFICGTSLSCSNIDNSDYDEEVSNATFGEICDLDLRVSGQIESLTHKVILCKIY